MSILTNIFQRGWNHQLGKHLVTPICKPWKGHLEKKSPPVWAHTHHGYLPLTVPGMILQVHSLKLTVRTWKQAGPQEEMSFEATMHLQGQTVSSQEAMLKKMKKTATSVWKSPEDGIKTWTTTHFLIRIQIYVYIFTRRWFHCICLSCLPPNFGGKWSTNLTTWFVQRAHQLVY